MDSSTAAGESRLPRAPRDPPRGDGRRGLHPQPDGVVALRRPGRRPLLHPGHAAPMKALVLGGGGVTGVGWMFGVLAGLAEIGLDLSRGQPPDLMVGTSAGSVVGAQVASGVDLEEAYARQLAAPSREIGAGFE